MIYVLLTSSTKQRQTSKLGSLSRQSLNVALFYDNKNEREYVSMIPTSAHSGDGMGDLMAYICRLSQSRLAQRLAYSAELQAIVMEVSMCCSLLRDVLFFVAR